VSSGFYQTTANGTGVKDLSTVEWTDTGGAVKNDPVNTCRSFTEGQNTVKTQMVSNGGVYLASDSSSG